MKTPPFLLGATLLFWGWQTGFPIPGAIMGAILELSRYVKLRWELADEDFRRIWTFCALLFLAAAVYAFADSGGPEGFGRFFQGPMIAAEHEAGSASARTAAELIRWLPMIFFLFVFAQVFSARQEIPLQTISLILQRRWKKAKKLGRPLPPSRGVDVTFPYFAVALLAASVHKNQNNNFFWGLCVLLGWVLWVQRPRRFGALVWVGTLMVAILFGYSGARSIGLVQRYLESFNLQLVSRMFGRRGTDPMKSGTQIGEIGRIETSSRIVVRLWPKVGEFPAYLREASYRTYRGTSWYANRQRSDFSPVDSAKTNENTWPLRSPKTNELRVEIASYLTDWDRQNRYSVGLLPLPAGSIRLENLGAYILQTNSMGTVIADGPGLLEYDVVYGPGATIDSPPETNVISFPFGNGDFRGRGFSPFGETNSPSRAGTNDDQSRRGFSPGRRPGTDFPGETAGPAVAMDSTSDTSATDLGMTNSELRRGFGRFGDTNWTRFGTNSDRPRFRGGFNISTNMGTDLQIPTNEIPALNAVVDELNLRGKSREEVLRTVSQFFETKFTYRLWQDADNNEPTNGTPLGRFLLQTRAGHCEYFATATVLLLRDLGIPTRYAVGYSVHESGWSGYLVRQSDAHAWCLVWNPTKGIWDNFDTTPGTGTELHHNRAALWFTDAWSWVRFEFSKLRWGQTHLRNYILVGLVPVLALLLIQILRQRKRGAGAKGAARRSILWPGLDSEFYQIEKQLTQRGLVRGPNEPLAEWLERAAAEPSLAELKDPLRALLRLHYRYRFDPNGLTEIHREELRQEARACLERLARLERVSHA